MKSFTQRQISQAERLIKEIGGTELELRCLHRMLKFLPKNAGIVCAICQQRWLRRRADGISYLWRQGR